MFMNNKILLLALISTFSSCSIFQNTKTITQDIAENVISETEEYMNTESQLRKDILSGVDPKEAYLKYRVF